MLISPVLSKVAGTVTHPLPQAKQPQRPARTSWLHRIAGLFGKSAKSRPISEKVRTQAGPPILTKAETALLPPFLGLPPDCIHVPHTKAECEAAAQEILAAGVAGFDTEARPTFKAGEKSSGPHVVQFALTDRAFIFQLHRSDCLPIIASLIESDRVLKVGFGLRNDHGQIRQRLGVQLTHVLDLDHIFRKRGHRDQIGVRRAMAEVLQQSFPKSKSITTSNWAAKELTTNQLRYAANDAYAALKIMEALNIKPADLSATNGPERRRRRKPRKGAPHPSPRAQGA